MPAYRSQDAEDDGAREHKCGRDRAEIERQTVDHPQLPLFSCSSPLRDRVVKAILMPRVANPPRFETPANLLAAERVVS